MIKRIISFILSAVMLITIMLPVPGSASVSETDGEDSQNHISSAYACDIGDEICLSDGGALILSGRTLIPSGVGEILYSGGNIYYASGNTVNTYNVRSGKIKKLGEREGDIISFSLYDGRIFAYDGSTVSELDGDAIIEMRGSMYALTGDHSWEQVALDDCLFYELVSENELRLYFANPEYVEDDAYNELEQYLIYDYVKGKDYLSVYSEYETENNETVEAVSYDAGTSYTIGKSTFPLDEYPVGSFFTKNGKSCTCHNQNICVASGPRCNCMRYWPTGNASTCEIDLLSSQCYGFAEFCQYRAYGYYDKTSPNYFYNAFGSKVSGGTWTANKIKQVFTSVGAGGHLRVSGHSLFVISVSNTGFITYECNKSLDGSRCIIYTTSWTWDSFYNRRKSSDILWYYLPKDSANIPVIDTSYETGNYQVKASTLNLRENASTSSSILTTIPNDAIIQITGFNSAYTWGKTEYNGKSGWVSLEYVFYLTSNIKNIYIETPPDKTTYFTDDKFSTDGLAVYAQFIDGTTAEISGYTCSGYNMKKAGSYDVKVSYEKFSTTFKITVEQKRIYPTSVKLDTSKLSLIVGDSYSFTYTIAPSDANMLGVTWSTSNASVASVSGGHVEPLKEGRATITITTENGLTASCTLTVVKMPSGTSWSTDYKGEPLDELPLGITTVDYSVRYRFKQSDGSYGDWYYVPVGTDLPADELEGKTVQYQYRTITASFISDGKDAFTPFPVDINSYIDLSKYKLEKPGYLFAGWFKTGQAALALDSSKAYKNSVMVDGDMQFYAGWVELEQMDADVNDPTATTAKVENFGFAGTGLCEDASNMGIRFFSRISSDLVSTLTALGNKCEYGTVVVLKDSLSSNLVISGSNTLLSSKRPVKVVSNKTFLNCYGASPDSSDDYIIYDALVTGYSNSYITKNFAARPYITYRDANGNTHTYYYTCTGNSTFGGAYYTSLYEVALAAYENSENQVWIRENILNKAK